MKELIVALMVWISANSGLPIPDSVPAVRYVTSCELQKDVYGERYDCLRAQEGRVLAYYLLGTVVLQTGFDPNDPFDRSLLLHELVHFMQDKAGLLAKAECRDRDLEVPAYRLQRKYMREQMRASDAERHEKDLLGPEPNASLALMALFCAEQYRGRNS